MSGRPRRLLPWAAGLAALARSPRGLKVDKARGKACFLTHSGPDGDKKPLWFDLDQTIQHYELKRRPQIVIRLLDADRKYGVDVPLTVEEKASR